MPAADELFAEIARRRLRGEPVDTIYCHGPWFERAAAQLNARIVEASDGWDHFMVNAEKVGWVRVQKVH